MKSSVSDARSSIEPMKSWVASDLQRVEALLLAHGSNDLTPLLSTVTTRLINAGGKRIRAMLTIISADMFLKCGDAHILLASAIELMHTATLLHDDVIDESSCRRGEKTAHLLWGNKVSILSGDYLLAQSFQLMIKAGSLDVLELLMGVAASISKAEVWQLANLRDTRVGEHQYLEVIKNKTALLFSAACRVGGMINGATAIEINALGNFGLHLGILFQVIDDVLDYRADTATYDKEIGKDLSEGKVTLPLIIALNRATDPDKDVLVSLINGSVSESDLRLKIALQLFEKYAVFEYCNDFMTRCLDSALEALEPLRKYEESMMLEEVLFDTIQRGRIQ
ncbi:polyprenyl synthetase family protein [Rickettsiales endosymbiont of Peranema trichophorum]|uniref:polyprenyl synthetase family protein n=1 Tax=Rickettsiales endosymbiont of Peranema trichophorum TaxID=2486577 RepID=UPI00102318D4|nr:polyprenyl synthetase family protein [Rickettsiales endosymbiont of Peranema trichophorum]RZI45244.1 polyprenyl synthetase family protein [Rickettsiales endosymbiont of Peranema trichophorum]